MKMELDYSKLRSMDIAAFSGHGIVSTVARISFSGWEYIFNHDIACHIGVVVNWHGNFFIAEADGTSPEPMIKLNSPRQYLDTKNHRYLIDIVRHPVYDDETKRESALKRISDNLFEMKGFDFRAAFWVFMRCFYKFKFKHNPDEYYCSEFGYVVTKDDIDYPEEFKYIVPPDAFYKSEGYYSTGALIKNG